MKPLIAYTIARSGQLPPYDAQAYEYITGQNGVFIRSERDYLSAVIPVAPAVSPIRGLALVNIEVTLPNKVPAEIVQRMLDEAMRAAKSEPEPLEILFYLLYTAEGWELVTPDQIQKRYEVRPTDTGPDSSYARAIIEVHSHHFYGAHFSPQDDIDEMGFRVYAVIGSFGESRPELTVRVGIHGHRCEVPPDLVFELPEPFQYYKEDIYGS